MPNLLGAFLKRAVYHELSLETMGSINGPHGFWKCIKTYEVSCYKSCFFFFGHWGIGEGKEYGTGFKLCPLWIPTLKRATELPLRPGLHYFIV